MELICNELSFFPLAKNSREVEERFITMLRTFRNARETYDFSHIRFPINYSEQLVMHGQTLMEWISEYNDPTKRNLILSWFKNPFTDELSEVESEKYFESEYIITSEAAPQRESPVGITVASIKMLPTISFDSHTFWRNKEIEISRTCQTQASNSTLEVHNICLESDITSSEFNRWLEEFYPHFISGEGMVRMYLNYGKYASRFTPTFLQHFKEWKKEDIVTFKYILRLMKDIEHFPFAGGMGQTENLKGRGKEGSKRINNKYPDGDRLSYSIEQNIVTFIACKGHYEFHD